MTPNLEDRIIFRAEPGMRAALIKAARRQGTSASEMLRVAARAAIQSATAPHPQGSAGRG